MISPLDHRWSGPVLKELDELELDGLAPETFHTIPGARVIFANHALLRRDFPGLCNAGCEEIEQWLLRHAAILSTPQCEPSEVIDGVDTSTLRTVIGYRPPRYGRAVVVPTEGGGLLDVKGVGVVPGKKPQQRIHKDGFLWLGFGIFDTIYQCIIEEIFARNSFEASTLPVYGLIDLGLDGRLPWREMREQYPLSLITGSDLMKKWEAAEVVRELEGATTPVCILVRRAHRRDPQGLDLPEAGSWQQETALRIELLLRRYGMTSCQSYTQLRVSNRANRLRVMYGSRRMPIGDEDHKQRIRDLTGVGTGEVAFDGVNIQYTRNSDASSRHMQLVDFGQYYAVRGQFQNPLLSRVRDPEALLRWGGAVYPDDARFVQPSPELRLEETYWGNPEGLQFNAIETPRYVYWAPQSLHLQQCMKIADQLRAGLASCADVVAFMQGKVREAIGEV